MIQSKDSNEGSSLALVSASMHVRNVGAHIDEHPELWNVIRDPMRKLRGEDVPEFDSSEKKTQLFHRRWNFISAESSATVRM